MYAPTDVHLTAAGWILCYLKKDMEKKLLYTKSKKFSVDTYTDADWAGSVDDSRSTFGYCIYLEENLVIWRSKRQIVCTRSSVEIEYKAFALGVTELIWIKIFLKDMRLQVKDLMKLFCYQFV